MPLPSRITSGSPQENPREGNLYTSTVLRTDAPMPAHAPEEGESLCLSIRHLLGRGTSGGNLYALGHRTCTSPSCRTPARPGESLYLCPCFARKPDKNQTIAAFINLREKPRRSGRGVSTRNLYAHGRRHRGNLYAFDACREGNLYAFGLLGPVLEGNLYAHARKKAETRFPWEISMPLAPCQTTQARPRDAPVAKK